MIPPFPATGPHAPDFSLLFDRPPRIAFRLLLRFLRFAYRFRPRLRFSLRSLLIIVLAVQFGLAAAWRPLIKPWLDRRHITGNEAGAIAALRAINTAEQQYKTGEVGSKYGLLSTLSGIGSPTYLDTIIGSGTKSGYTFVMIVGQAGQSYSVRAAPVRPGITGNRYFFTNSGAVIFHSTTPLNGYPPFHEHLPD